ncbi:MAG: ABC transporter ATP-binding protein/permease [Cytophagaceae bacterium]|nr:ABC transporter ATP-binding protein/permease [Cytophagaceae bacterium]
MDLLWNYFRSYWKLCLLALLLAAVNTSFSLLDPFLYRRILDQYVQHYKEYELQEFLWGVGMLLSGVVGVAMISRIAKNFQDYFVSKAVQKIGTKIYTDGIQHAMHLPYQVFEDQRSGETLGILQKVRTDMERLTQSFIGIIFATLIGIIFVTVYSLYVYWVIAPFYLATIPLIALVSFYLSKKIKTVQKSIVKETTALAGSTTESLRNIELVKGLGLVKQEVGRLNAISSKILTLELKKVKYVRSLSFLQGTLVNLIRTALSFFLIYLIFQGKISIGEFFSLFMYSFYVFGPLQEIGSFINIYRETEVSFNSFKKMLAIPKEPRPALPKRLSQLSSVRFDQVQFQHASSRKAAVQELSFEVQQGQTIAFVGPSGSGKTTILKLLVGLYRPASGDILYNGLSYQEIETDDFRIQIGLVTQDTQLFSGTLRENLQFVKPEAKDEELLEVLKKSACTSLLNRADKGLETVIGEGGIKVSGGEKQRIAIARALLRQPRILIFDEATSALDSITEEEITETIKHVSADQQHITVLVAHRLSTIMHADCIYVMEQGKISEFGSHEKLLANQGLYAAMWRQQAGEREDTSIHAH